MFETAQTACMHELEITRLIKTLRVTEGIIREKLGKGEWEKACDKYSLFSLSSYL